MLTASEVHFTKTELWSTIHLGTAILCACLPTYRPMLSRLPKLKLAQKLVAHLDSLSRKGKFSKRFPSDGQNHVGNPNNGNGNLITCVSMGESFEKAVLKSFDHIESGLDDQTSKEQSESAHDGSDRETVDSLC